MRGFSAPRLIERKRDGVELAPGEIEAFLSRFLTGEVPDYQMAAMLMAVFFRGLSPNELERWTLALVQSGERWDFRRVTGPKVGKHSTGGVGDKVTLVLAPLVAAVGLKMPKVSGRGLGHTGGTLDKLASIPGFRTDLDRAAVERLLNDVGYALAGQSDSFVPLDRDLYALRDVTGTVESLPLVAASVMSKKIAEGLDAVVLDVKTGAGALLSDPERAEALARAMLGLAGRFGLRAEALMTRMDEPLGRAVGNALEVREAIETLAGRGPADVLEVAMALGSSLLVQTGAAPDDDAARARLRWVLEDGSALERFRLSVAGQGGDPAVVDDPGRLPRAPASAEARAPRAGRVRGLDAREVGRLVVALGGGRLRKTDAIDPSVGVVLEQKVGDEVETGGRLATVHAATPEAALGAAQRLAELYDIGPEPLKRPPLVLKRITG
ncbi:MAG TPA: thymidine phosphorylase [Gemmatimonadota bacterium]